MQQLLINFEINSIEFQINLNLINFKINLEIDTSSSQ